MTDRRTLLTRAAAAAGVALTPAVTRAQGGSARIRVRDGTEIYVRNWGDSGRPVVLTHAWPISAEVWEAQGQALAMAGYRVFAPDRRGFGWSGKPATGYDYDTFADDLATVVADLNLRDATLVGYSMGGGEVVRYFSRHGGRGVVKAGFVAAVANYALKTEDNPDGRDASGYDVVKQAIQNDRASFLPQLLGGTFFDTSRPAARPVTPEGLQRWLSVAMQASPQALVACVDAFSRTDFRPELSAVKAPTLVLHGTADLAVPIALARATARGIPGSKLIEYEGASHGLVVTEADRVTRDLLNFLAG